jgi:catechol 2,3-dioxygenase-like lactoylglutathione lyase family enzyme
MDRKKEGSLFTHIVVGANDLIAAKQFYDQALGALGYEPGAAMGDRVIYATGTGILMVTKPIDGNPACYGNGITIGLSAPDVAAVDAFHAKGLAAGGSDGGAPGPRDAIPNSYAAYVRDPTGNKLVAWCVAGG